MFRPKNRRTDTLNEVFEQRHMAPPETAVHSSSVLQQQLSLAELVVDISGDSRKYKKRQNISERR